MHCCFGCVTSARHKSHVIISSLQQILDETIFAREYAVKDKKHLFIKRILVSILIAIILGLAAWAIAATVSKYAHNLGTLKGLLLLPSPCLSSHSSQD